MYTYREHEIDETATPEIQELQKLVIDKAQLIEKAKYKILRVLQKCFNVDKVSLLKPEDYESFKIRLKKLK